MKQAGIYGSWVNTEIHFRNGFLTLLFCACILYSASGAATHRGEREYQDDQGIIHLVNGSAKVDVNAVTFLVSAVDSKGKVYNISAARPAESISGLKSDGNRVSWNISGSGIAVSLDLQSAYLDVTIRAKQPAQFTWPLVKAASSAFTIPFYQGKYIPSTDRKWISYLESHSPFSGNQDLSMQFYAANFDDMALVYVIKNMFNNELSFFDNAGILSLKFTHEFPATVQDKQYGFRIYLTPNNPVAIAKTYKQYVTETGKIVTLEEKAGDNPLIRRLYGAPHIYMWNTEFLTDTDITNWKGFKEYFLKELQSSAINPSRHLYSLFQSADAESGREFINQLDDFKKEQFVIKYHKALLTRAFNEVLLRRDLYNADAWKNIPLGEETRSLIKDIDHLNAVELYRLNESLFYSAYPGMCLPVSDWGGTPLSLIDEMQTAGIKTAWMGLNDWGCAEKHPDFIKKAMAAGYLVGPYDSYHSMHPPGKARWITAAFEDTSLYTTAFVTNKRGKPYGGFLGEGRKLNPVLSMPAVKERMTNVMMNSENSFNSWFIDCDATGEVFDDYSPGRMTSESEDIDARLKRMAWIRDTYKLVIGSEVGNDFAAGTIAFGHGMTTPVVAWGDPDMRNNKQSPYYIGAYFSNSGGVPDRYAMQAPVKEKYHYIYFDNRFNIPLFQLVYNNSVITSHHWEWNSLKVPAEIKSNELKEILFNVPPLYHLDQNNWNKFKDLISRHVQVFSRTHNTAIKLEMKEFEWLTNDRLVQRTMFGDSLEIIANFGEKPFVFKGKPVPPTGLLIHQLSSDDYEIYKP